MEKNTLEKISQGRENNLNLVRLVAALMVMYMHAFALGNGKLEQDIMYTLTFHKALSGQVGVDIFFVISGFLIYRSYDRGNKVGKYLKARFLRIWPLLGFFVLSTAFIFGPMFSVLDRDAYFAGHETGHVGTYLLNLIFISGANRLPGVFSFHANQSANGSIWTLQHEVLCYLIVLVMVPLFRKHKKAIFAFIAVSVAIYFSMKYGSFSSDLVPVTFLVNFGRLTWEFEMGVLYYLYKDKIIMSWKIALAALVGLVATSYFADYEIAFTIFGAYIVLYIGFSYWGISKLYNKVGDISYGVYIFSFFVQQRVIDLMGYSLDGYHVLMDPMTNFGVSVAVVIPLALLSWHCFEKQLLKLK